MNATARTLEALNITDCALEFQNLGLDSLVWTARTTSAAGAGTVIPELEQTVELFDGDGTRRFKGHVLGPEMALRGVKVLAVGPWWWMERISLSGDVVDSTGATQERASYVFPTQGLKTSLESLIDRAIDKGVPMVRGTVSSVFQVPKISLQNMSFAAAFAELLRWVPDAVLWFDYSGTTPEINITRRGDMTELSYTLGTANVESVALRPRLDLKVARVALKHVKRDPATGKPYWATQADGSSTPGRVQILTVSGPEITSILPKDDFDSVKLKTKAAVFGTPDFFDLDPVLKQAQEDYGSFLGTITSGPSFSGWHRLLSGDLADWLRKDYGLEKKTVRVAGWFSGTYLASGSLGECAGELKGMGRLSWAVGGTGDYNTFKLFVDFSVELINLSYPQTTTVRKKWDYDYLQPPTGLAANLKGTQDWLPWEGEVTLVDDTVSGYNGLRRKFNLYGGHPDHETMDALVSAVQYDIMRGRWTYRLGPPARTDFGTLVSRIRREPSDNIEWIED
jgi:hypothetical protein